MAAFMTGKPGVIEGRSGRELRKRDNGRRRETIFGAKTRKSENAKRIDRNWPGSVGGSSSSVPSDFAFSLFRAFVQNAVSRFRVISRFRSSFGWSGFTE
jgi:hypothetical protein